MVEGSVQKFLKEVTLLGQPFVKDDRQTTVEQLLKSKGASVSRFVLYVVGEGIEKKQSDFAAEVGPGRPGGALLTRPRAWRLPWTTNPSTNASS